MTPISGEWLWTERMMWLLSLWIAGFIMKISELIEFLWEIKEQYGDIRCMQDEMGCEMRKPFLHIPDDEIEEEYKEVLLWF